MLLLLQEKRMKTVAVEVSFIQTKVSYYGYTIRAITSVFVQLVREMEGVKVC